MIPDTVITSKGQSLAWKIREILRYRDLFVMLTVRDFKVRYAQTALGFLWAFVQPVAILIILTIVFERAFHVETVVPYPLFAASGLIVWTYFAFVLSQAGTSVISGQELVRKVYFPRVILPMAKGLLGLVDLCIALVILIVLMIYFKSTLSANVVVLPLFLLAGLLVSVGVGLWVSALAVRYRDILHVIPFLVQFGLYATPVAYPAERVIENLPTWAAWGYYVNPMAGVIEGVRWSLWGGPIHIELTVLSLVVGLLIFISGLTFFNRLEPRMADIV